MSSNLANGQLASSSGTLLGVAPPAARRKFVDIKCYNTSGSLTETVSITVSLSGGTARTVARAALAPREFLIIENLALDDEDLLAGSTTTAATVDYIVSESAGGTFHVLSLDTNGAIKQVNSGTSGNQTISGDLTVTGGMITLSGATTENILAIPDNLADGFSVKVGSTFYATVITTDDAERIVLKKQTRLADSVKLALGDGDDITIAWDGTDLDILQAAVNSSIKWGISGAGIDQVWYGDTVAADMTWDQSADSLIFGDAAKVVFGTGSDITIAWDGTDLDILQAAENSSIKWGIDGAGIDHVFYGDTASTSMTWDQSADTLLFTGACRVLFTGTTGQPEIHLTDNLADALSIKIPSGNDLMFFTTTNSAEAVVIPAALIVGSDTADRVAIKGIYMTPAAVAVTIPSFAAETTDSVDVDVAAALSMVPAVGDLVFAIPQEALPTDCLLAGAIVTATDTIRVSFDAKEGGGVTGAAKNFKFVVIDLT